MASPAKPLICIVTPGTREANNGNWRTAARWAGMLRHRYAVILQSEWDGTPAAALVALHARRSASSISAFRARMPGKPVALVLTGTDLYRDFPASAEVHASLEAADRIVTLQAEALELLPHGHRAKARVIFQSARALRHRPKSAKRLECVVVGHLREEKDPRTLFAAVERLAPGMPITVRHFGAPLDSALGDAATKLARTEPRYRYEGAQPRDVARAAMQHAHLLVHPSAMEGGANVIVESITSGTPVIASRVAGNVGMLGRDYPGYFEPGDASGLAACLVRSLEEPRFLALLHKRCMRRSALFAPSTEARAVERLVAELLRRKA